MATGNSTRRVAKRQHQPVTATPVRCGSKCGGCNRITDIEHHAQVVASLDSRSDTTDHGIGGQDNGWMGLAGILDVDNNPPRVVEGEQLIGDRAGQTEHHPGGRCLGGKVDASDGLLRPGRQGRPCKHHRRCKPSHCFG